MSPRIIIGLILIAILTGGYFTIKHLYGKNEELKETVATQKNVIKQNNDTIDTKVKADAITEKVEVKVEEKQKEVRHTQATVKKDAEVNMANIEKQFEALPPTPETKEQEVKKIAEVQIDALWKAYCSGMPSDASCK